MVLPSQETARFYRIWFALLQYVNQQRRLVASFPTGPGIPGAATVATDDALELRSVLWADDALREQFLAGNPAGLPPADLALAASWRHRVAGSFFVVRHLKQHTIFLTQGTLARVYGVLGLTNPIAEVIGPLLPVLVQAVLLPFEGQIIYDSLLEPYRIIFGPGIRRSLNEAYRDAQEREGVITTLLPAKELARPEAVRAGVRGRNAKVLAAFRRELARAGLSPQTAARHVETINAFAQDCLLTQEPPRGLLDLTPADLHTYLSTTGPAANPVSFRRFVRFLAGTGRLEYEVAAHLSDQLKES